MDGQITATLDAIPTTQLQEQISAEFNVKKSTFYKAIADLNIPLAKSEVDRRATIVNAEDAVLVTDYFRRRAEDLNNPTPQTLSLSKANESTLRRTDKATELLMPALEIISRLVPAAPPADALATHRTLQEAADRSWQLSTHQLSKLLGRSPNALQKYQTFQQFGFTFESFEKGRFRTWSIHRAQP